MQRNPFTPAFGSEPLVLAGRERIIEDILEGLNNGPGDPNRSSILIGPRGSGKTVLLARIAHEAQQRGWIAANVTAVPGMLNGIVEQALENGREFLPEKGRSRLAGLGAFGLSVSVAALPEQAVSWRLQIARILEVLAEYDIGLLITVDEVDARFDEMLTLVADFQHFVREKRNVALLMAGLPGKVLQMFNNDAVSFVRRSFQHRLDTIKRDDARLAIRKTIEASGRSIESDALEVAVERTGGFPFLVQLVGYHIWRQSSQSKQISLEDARRGIISAEEDMDRMILETTIKELSDKDVAFLHAMAQDDAESRLGDVAKRLKISSAAAGQYRLRLIRQGVIEEYGRGKVQFALPLLRDYLRKTGA